MIRPCTEADIPFVMELGRKFADEAGVTDALGWDDDAVEALLRSMIADHILLRGDRSMIGGVVYPHPFSGRKVFQELFWRSEGREGLKLLAAAETVAKAMGAARCLMLDIASMGDLSGLYARRGYRPAERTFIKEL
jgi:hypothetical protein